MDPIVVLFLLLVAMAFWRTIAGIILVAIPVIFLFGIWEIAQMIMMVRPGS